MKQVKKLALFATIALGAMSCSNNEITETLQEQNEIRFASVQMNNGIITKANQALVGTETFGVYAYQTSASVTTWFEGQRLSKETEGVWGLPAKFYYPAGTFSMNFWAYGKEFDKNQPNSVSATGLVYTDYAVDQAKAADHEAFVISKNAVTVTEANKANGVALNFWHALSKIKFSAKIADITGFENVDVKITSISINTSKTGSINYASETSKWVPGAKSDETIALINNEALTSTMQDMTGSFYVIPLAQDADVNTITITADLFHKGTNIKIADQITGTISATGSQLAINNSVTYNVILDLTNAGLVEIKFAEPTVEDWSSVNGGDITHPIQANF